MGANPNTLTIQAVWDKVYQITHYTQPVFKAFATERLEAVLKMGDTVHRDYISDFLVNDMGGDGSYSTQAVTDTDEYLTVNKKKEVSFQIPDWQTFQMHLPTQKKAAEKAMARLWNNIDGQILADLQAAATTVVDDSDNGGTAKNGITINVGNVMAVFATAEQYLIKNNVSYIPGKQFTGIPMKDKAGQMKCAAISPEVYNQMSQFVAGKNSSKGDEVTTNGYIGYFFGFNVFVSNSLPFEAQLVLDTNPTANDTMTIGGVTFKFVVTPAAAGDLVIGSAAADTVNNAAAALNAPYTLIANTATTGYFPLVKATVLATTNGYFKVSMLGQITASNVVTATGVASASGTSLKILTYGVGSVVVSQSMTAAGNVWTAAKQIVHNIFGVSNSIDLLIQSRPHITVNPVSGKVAKDFITWNLFGDKVFTDQIPGIIDVKVNASAFKASAIEWK